MKSYDNLITRPLTKEEVLDILNKNEGVLDFIVPVELSKILSNRMNEDDLWDHLELCMTEECFLPRVEFDANLVEVDAHTQTLYFRLTITIDVEEFIHLNEEITIEK